MNSLIGSIRSLTFPEVHPILDFRCLCPVFHHDEALKREEKDGFVGQAARGASAVSSGVAGPCGRGVDAHGEAGEAAAGDDDAHRQERRAVS